MKKFGFTLAEVLITLGIIGVVAALTTPALVKNSKNEANGAKLAVVVSTMENAFGNAIASEGVETLFQTQLWQTVPAGGLDGGNGTDAQKAAFVGQLGKYMVTSGYRNINIPAFYGNVHIYSMTRTGGQGDIVVGGFGDGNGAFPIILKNGAVVFMRAVPSGTWAVNQDSAITAGSVLYDEAADIFIDVNGIAGPNIIGRDIFTFYLGQNGIMYPAGGMDVSVFDNLRNGMAANNNTIRNNIWSNAASNWRCRDGNINIGWGCTARLIEENYKMNY